MAVIQLFHISILLALSQMLYRAATQQCPAFASEISIFGWMLQRHIYKTMMADLGHVCLLACRQDDRCQSFNFVISGHMCEFSNRTKEARPEDFIPNPDRFYFRRDMNRGKPMWWDDLDWLRADYARCIIFYFANGSMVVLCSLYWRNCGFHYRSEIVFRPL